MSIIAEGKINPETPRTWTPVSAGDGRLSYRLSNSSDLVFKLGTSERMSMMLIANIHIPASCVTSEAIDSGELDWVLDWDEVENRCEFKLVGIHGKIIYNYALPAEGNKAISEVLGICSLVSSSSKELPPNPADPVNSPSHYNQGGIECIEAIRASMSSEEFQAYCKGNVMKYLWRYQHKNNQTEDCKKARWYLQRLIAELESPTDQE